MMKTFKPLWSALILASVLGCAGDETPPPATPPPTGDLVKPAPAEPKPEMKPAPKVDEMKPAPKVDEMKKDEAPKVEGPKAEAKPAKLTVDEIAEIKKLPADEATVALRQIVCPVSDEHLGEMGIPIKVTAEGKTFYLCCKSCEKEVKADPKAVVAKLTK